MLIVSVAWRGHTDAVAGSRVAVHVMTVIVAVSQVTITMVGRRPQDMGIREVQVVVMGHEFE